MFWPVIRALGPMSMAVVAFRQLKPSMLRNVQLRLTSCRDLSVTVPAWYAPVA